MDYFIVRDGQGQLVLSPDPPQWPNRIDKERALSSGSLRGEAMVAPPACNYPEGSIIDYFCLWCGMSFAAHGEDDDCAEELLHQLQNRYEHGAGI